VINNRKRFAITLLAVSVTFMSLAQSIDFSQGSIFVSPEGERAIQKPITVLKEEIYKRTGITLAVKYEVKSVAVPAEPLIILATTRDLSTLPSSLHAALDRMTPIGKDGFKLLIQPDTKIVVITGDDARSVLYGIGRLLRKAEMRAGNISVPLSTTISTTPVYSVRGHQLGYRPKTNSYDAFSTTQFDQYIRELALFGANSIEIVPPRTDDDATSVHMKLARLK